MDIHKRVPSRRSFLPTGSVPRATDVLNSRPRTPAAIHQSEMGDTITSRYPTLLEAVYHLSEHPYLEECVQLCQLVPAPDGPTRSLRKGVARCLSLRPGRTTR
jgi:hypothetical protein